MTYLDYLFFIYPVLYIVKVRGESAFTTDKYTSYYYYMASIRFDESRDLIGQFELRILP